MAYNSMTSMAEWGKSRQIFVSSLRMITHHTIFTSGLQSSSQYTAVQLIG